MKRLILILLLLPLALRAQVADTVDVVDCDVALDLSAGTPFRADATLTVRLLAPCDAIGLAVEGSVDSVWVDGVALEAPFHLDAIPTQGVAVGVPFTVRVCYRGDGFVEGNGWGGFHFDGGMSYNLGVGFGTTPHPLGRAVFPARDNFSDKSTYTLRITTRAGWTAECSGVVQSRSVDDGQREHSVWRIDQPVSSYLVGVSQAPFSRIESTVAGYPLTIGYTADHDSATVRSVFALLDTVVPMFERCFGPYRWHRIGYIPTAKGSMEHVNNIALATQAMASVSALGQSTIAHELGHAWFGNLVTCQEEGDMWINEGGASFCSEVAEEATSGRDASNRTYQENLERVVRTAHIDDGGYRPLHGMPHAQTYGTTTYDKGALVWHSLRGYLGDSLFYASMHKLFDRCAFSNIDAYALRDSLSLYSGVDLEPFFDFHVFDAGFVDYHVSMNTIGCGFGIANVSVSQQGVGTSSIARHSRVPVTLVGWEGEKRKVWLTLDSTETLINGSLPFNPAFCVLDLDCEISDAATVDRIEVSGSGSLQSNVCHMRIKAQDPEQEATYYVEHHFGKPHGVEDMEGVIRTANRYWVVNSTCWSNSGVQGQFRYSRSGYMNADYPELDRGFLRLPASSDSLGLLWRLNPYSPWELVSCRHSGSHEGYLFVNGLRTGEYTLAVVDTNVLGISATDAATSINLFPNPVHSGEPLTIDVPTDQPFSVSIFDTAGHLVWQQKQCNRGASISPKVKTGSYLLVIENNYLSLQTKLIVI